jgi:hypothetical protein
MKNLIKNTFFVLLLSIAGSVYSQVVVSVEKNNYVYAGIENPISVAVDGINSEFIEVTCENAEIKKHDGVRYQIIPMTNVREVQLSIYSTKGETKELVSTYSLRVLRVPAPEVMLANKVVSNETQEIQRNVLIANPYLILRQNSDFIFDLKYMVTGFTIVYKIDGKQVKHQIEGYKIPANIINELRSLPENTEVEFLDIMYSVSNETSYSARDVKIILK